MAVRTNRSAPNASALIASAAFVACVAGTAPALAQDAGSVNVDLGECVDLESPDERFACYEARVEAAMREHGAAAPPAPEPEEHASSTAAAPVARDDETRRRRRDERAESADESAGQASVPGEIVATITALRQTVPNSYLITLDNGQVWRQMRPKWYPLQPGHEVRIYSTRWGSAFRLSAVDVSGFIQVERVR